MSGDKKEFPPPFNDAMEEKDIDEILAGTWSPEGVETWWSRQRVQLGGVTPQQAWDEGRRLEVYHLAVSGLGQVAT